MKIINTPIADLKIVELDIYRDDRGFFVERYNEKKFQELGISTKFVQDNCSKSIPGVIRGLHYQMNPDQAKLVGCISGRILDVVVDIRKNSPTFGEYFAIELTGENGKLLYVPGGFAHGFCVLGNEIADVTYKVDAFYSKEGEGGIIYSDPDLKIDWPIKNPIVSKKDLVLPTLQEFKNKIHG